MPISIDGYSAHEDFIFYGEKFRVTMSFGTVALNLGSSVCAYGMQTEDDGVVWTSVYSHPGATGPATQVVRDMIHWSREQRKRWEHKHKYGYYPGEHVE